MAAPSVSYTFTNGTAADADQVSTNFSDIINGISDGTKDLTINDLTCNGTLDVTGDVAINTNKFNITAASGNTSLAGTLTMSGANAITLRDVTMNSSAAGYLDFTAATRIQNICNAIYFGDGTTGISLIFNGTNTGNIAWDDPNDRFQSADDMLFTVGAKVLFRDTSSYIYDDGTDLNIITDGVLKFGTHAAVTTETLSGFITIKDAAGNTRKLAVVS